MMSISADFKKGFLIALGVMGALLVIGLVGKLL